MNKYEIFKSNKLTNIATPHGPREPFDDVTDYQFDNERPKNA